MDDLSPTARLWFIVIALILATGVAYAYWPSVIGLTACLVALLILLPLTLVAMLDVIREIKSRSQSLEATAARIVLSVPLALLALFALVIGITFSIFLGVKVSSEPLSESPRVLIGGIIAGAMFLGFGIKLLQVLWSRKHDKTIP